MKISKLLHLIKLENCDLDTSILVIMNLLCIALLNFSLNDLNNETVGDVRG